MIAQSEYGSSGGGGGGGSGGNNYSNYGSIAAYQSGSAANNSTLGGTMNNVTTNNSIASNLNPYGAGSVIGSSNGYSNMLSSISSGGITSATACYPISSTHHLQASDKGYAKDR